MTSRWVSVSLVVAALVCGSMWLAGLEASPQSGASFSGSYSAKFCNFSPSSSFCSGTITVVVGQRKAGSGSQSKADGVYAVSWTFKGIDHPGPKEKAFSGSGSGEIRLKTNGGTPTNFIADGRVKVETGALGPGRLGFQVSGGKLAGDISTSTSTLTFGRE